MFKPKEMTWKQFEKYCEDLIQRCFPDDKKYRVKCQKEVTYRDGVTKRMDISIAERRPGGRHYVVDCKHFPTAILNENEIQTTLEYKRLSKAAKAIILISGAVQLSGQFFEICREAGGSGHTSKSDRLEPCKQNQGNLLQHGNTRGPLLSLFSSALKSHPSARIGVTFPSDRRSQGGC